MHTVWFYLSVKFVCFVCLSESYGFLKGVLDELSDIERSALIQDWSTNGQVYLDFININQVRTGGQDVVVLWVLYKN